MDVGVVVLIILAQCIEDRARFLRTGRAVEVYQVMPAHLLLQDRKVGADRAPVRLVRGGHAGNLPCRAGCANGGIDPHQDATRSASSTRSTGMPSRIG